MLKPFMVVVWRKTGYEHDKPVYVQDGNAELLTAETAMAAAEFTALHRRIPREIWNSGCAQPPVILRVEAVES